MDIIHLHPLCIADSGVSLLGKLLEKYLMDSALAEFSVHGSFKASSINNFILIMEQMTACKAMSRTYWGDLMNH